MSPHTSYFLFGVVLLAIAGVFAVLHAGYSGDTESAAEGSRALGVIFTYVAIAMMFVPVVWLVIEAVHHKTGRLGFLVEDSGEVSGE